MVDDARRKRPAVLTQFQVALCAQCIAWSVASGLALCVLLWVLDAGGARVRLRRRMRSMNAGFRSRRSSNRKCVTSTVVNRELMSVRLCSGARLLNHNKRCALAHLAAPSCRCSFARCGRSTRALVYLHRLLRVANVNTAHTHTYSATRAHNAHATYSFECTRCTGAATGAHARSCPHRHRCLASALQTATSTRSVECLQLL